MRSQQPTFFPSADQRIWMNGLSWSAFESFVALRGNAGPRVTYLEGTLELMSPSRDHEVIKKYLGAVIEAYLDHLGIRYEGVGSWLLTQGASKAALEPDECYILHIATSHVPTSPSKSCGRVAAFASSPCTNASPFLKSGSGSVVPSPSTY